MARIQVQETEVEGDVRSLRSLVNKWVDYAPGTVVRLTSIGRHLSDVRVRTITQNTNSNYRNDALSE